MWLGNEDKNGRNDWRWNDGSSFQFPKSFWVPGEPNNIGQERCLRVARYGNNYRFRSTPCGKNYAYVVCGDQGGCVGGWVGEGTQKCRGRRYGWVTGLKSVGGRGNERTQKYRGRRYGWMRGRKNAGGRGGWVRGLRNAGVGGRWVDEKTHKRRGRRYGWMRGLKNVGGRGR